MSPRKYKTRMVCKGCNNGWMSRLEADVLNLVGILIEPQWPTWMNPLPTFYNLQEHGELLVMWMLKTALLAEQAKAKEYDRHVPADIVEMVRNRKFTDDFYLMAGHIEQAGFNFFSTPGFPTLNGGARHPFQVDSRGRSLSFAIQLNHFALRLYKSPEGCPDMPTLHTSRPHDEIAAPIWLYPRNVISHRPIHKFSFKTMNDFNDSVHIRVASPKV